MNTYKKTAVLVGLFFIIGTVSGVLSVIFLGSFLEDPEYLANIALNNISIISGVLCILTMGFSLTMVPILLYPIFKSYNAVLAMGAVVFRGALEAVVYMAQAVLWLLLLTVSQEFRSLGSTEITIFQHLGDILLQADVWLAHVLSIVFSLGALMIYWVFYRMKLIPNWLSIWGLIGGLLYFVSPITGLFGLDLGFLMLPLAVQEMVLALWLIIKGFNPNAIAKLNK
jgi:hypothetical protein